MNRRELEQWVHDKASMNNSPETAKEIVEAVKRWFYLNEATKPNA